MKFARTLAVAAATAVVSLGVGPIADAAHAGQARRLSPAPSRSSR